MSRTAPIIATSVILASCERGGAPELQGQWVSDSERTLAEIPSDTDLSEKQIEFLRGHLGKLVLVKVVTPRGATMPSSASAPRRRLTVRVCSATREKRLETKWPNIMQRLSGIVVIKTLSITAIPEDTAGDLRGVSRSPHHRHLILCLSHTQTRQQSTPRRRLSLRFRVAICWYFSVLPLNGDMSSIVTLIRRLASWKMMLMGNSQSLV